MVDALGCGPSFSSTREVQVQVLSFHPTYIKGYIMKSDIEWIEELKEKAKNRELGINSINYYYSLKHLLELVCPGGESVNAED